MECSDKPCSRISALEAALRDAAQSLLTLSFAGARSSDLRDLDDVRGYANSRQRVAHAALKAPCMEVYK
jgi:hypothetical protein